MDNKQNQQPRKISRREFLRQAALYGAGAGAASLIASCAPVVAPSSAPSTSATAAPTVVSPAGFDWKRFNGRTIRALLWEHPEVNEWKKMMPEFESLTGIKVNLEQASVADVYTKTILELTTAPEKLDVYSLVPPQHAKQFTRDGFMANLKPLLNDSSLTSPDFDYADFLPGAAGSLTFGDLIGGIPMYIQTNVLTYRKDLYEAKGLKPPETFEQLMSNAAAIHDPTNQQYGVVMRGIGPQAVWHWSAWMWGYGGDWVDANGKAAINSPQAVESMKVYGDTLGKYGPPGPTDLDDGRMVALFLAGQAGHHYSNPAYSRDFADPAKSKVAGKIGWTLVPGGPAGRFTESVGVGLALSSKSPNIEPSWYFLQWLTNKDIMLHMQSDVGILTGRKSAWESPRFSESTDKAGMTEWREVVIKALQNGRGDPLPPVEQMAAARDAIGTALTAAIKGEPIQPVADAANEKYQALL